MAEILSGSLAAALNSKIIDEAFEIARSNRTGILSTVGFGTPMVPYEGYKQSWTDFRIDAQGSSADGAAGAGDTTITVADGSVFRPGMQISAAGSDEVMMVTAVTGDDLTVVRGFGGTTGAAIPDAAAITVDSTGREENSLTETDNIVQPELVENYFQTMDTAIEMSRRAEATNQFTDTNDMAFQISERLRQLAIQMDRALVRGRRGTVTIGGKERTYSGGINFYNDQAGAIKTDAAAAALTLDAINALNAEIVTRGGMANTVAVGIAKARAIQALVNANYQSQRLADWTADEGSVLRLPSDLPLIGNVTNIVIDTNLLDSEMVMYDTSKISIIPMAAGQGSESGNWRTKDATQPGQDGEIVRVIGDFSFQIRQANTHMAKLHNLA